MLYISKRNKTIFFILIFSLGILFLNAISFIAVLLDEEDKSPIPGAIIFHKDKQLISNNFGGFTIRDASLNDSIKVVIYGYYDKKLLVSDIIKGKKIYLKRKVIQLDNYIVKYKKPQENKLSVKQKITISPDENSALLPNILEDETALSSRDSGLEGEEKKLSFPGFQSRHTVVMIDGIVVNKSGEAFDLASIPVEIVDKVEIVKGSSSSIAGSGSMGGIINIITKTDSKNYVKLNYGMGSFSLQKAKLDFSFRRNNLNFNGLIKFSDTKNNFKFKPRDYWDNPDSLRTRINNDKRTGSFNTIMSYVKGKLFVRNRFEYQTYKKMLPGPTNNPELYEKSFTKGEKIRDVFYLNIINTFLNPELYLYMTDDFSKFNNLYTDSYYAMLSKSYFNDRGIKFSLSQDFKTNELTFISEYKREDFSYKYYSKDLIFNPQKSIDPIFKEYYAFSGLNEFSKEICNFKLGESSSIRYDFSNAKEDFLSWNFSPEISYNFYHFDVTYSFSLGNGFTYPSFMNLYWKGDSQATGNPNLKPEKSSQISHHLGVSDYRNFISVTLRNQKIDDMIIWFQDFNFVWKPKNVSSVEISSIDVDFKLYLFNEFFIKGNSTITKAIDKSKINGNETASYGKKITFTPDRITNLALVYDNKVISSKVSYTYTGKQWTKEAEPHPKYLLPSYELWNYSFDYSFDFYHVKYSAYFHINNLFDKLYEIYEYIPQPGRNFEFGLQLHYEF